MANTVCHNGYCEPTLNREDSFVTSIGDKVIIGGFAFFVITSLALSIYGVLMGYYPDPSLLP